MPLFVKVSTLCKSFIFDTYNFFLIVFKRFASNKSIFVIVYRFIFLITLKKRLMKYAILLCILLNTALVTAQNTVQGLPTFLWSVTKQKFYGDKIEFNMSAKIPDGWMIFTERDTVVIPLEVAFSSTDSLLINKVLITQIKGVKGSNDKLRFVFGDNIEITKGDVEYIVTIFLKKGKSI